MKALALENTVLKTEYDKIARKESEYVRTIEKMQKQLDQRE